LRSTLRKRHDEKIQTTTCTVLSLITWPGKSGPLNATPKKEKKKKAEKSPDSFYALLFPRHLCSVSSLYSAPFPLVRIPEEEKEKKKKLD
jgi:hypothetical protein